nr:lytic transglycosylase domain-containing protein [uncultured Flavobacterium sp.]
MKKIVLLASLFFSFAFSFAQESAERELPIFVPKLTYLDSLKSTFINHSTSVCIDERWMKELANIDISKEMFEDITTLNLDEKVDYNLDVEILKKRLKKLDAHSPFVIEYNQTLENTIKIFLKKRSKSIERQMAIAEYYFPMFEEHLAKYNVPLEIKYLAIVESALNPKAKSRVGAGGLWQFMPATGKQYKLNVTSYVDDRHDPIKATEAACQYLSNMYAIFGDWSLVLASYNCGPNNVSKAIRRAGGSNDYWEIRKFLPKETANYVPAFLATMYIYEFKKELGLTPKKAPVAYFQTDTVAVKRGMTFKQIADLLDVTVDEIEFFNPTFKNNFIPSYENELYFLRLPKDKIGLFVSNEDKIYAYLEYLEAEKLRKVQLAKIQKQDSIAKQDSIVALEEKEFDKIVTQTTKEVVKKEYYKVKKGETLSKIATINNVSVEQLKKWNTINGTTINEGQYLVLQKTKKITVNEIVKVPKTKTEQLPNSTGDNIVKLDKKPTNKEVITKEEEFYTVQKGDSIFSISKKYPNVTVDDLKKNNNLCDDNIQPGMKLKING